MIKESFERYMVHVFHGINVSNNQREELRKAFYAGIDTLMGKITFLSENNRIIEMSGLYLTVDKELKKFNDEQLTLYEESLKGKMDG